jgi:SAM-dependent methyltransferase
MLTRAGFYADHVTDVPLIGDRMLKVRACALERPFSSLLDIGCGRGTLIEALRERAPDVSYTGLELSEESAQIATAKGIDVMRRDLAEPLPFPDESFDVVTFGEVIEHLFDPDSVLDEIHRILKPGGRLIVTTPNLACWLNRILVPAGFQPIFTEPSARKKYGFFFKFLGQNGTLVQGHIRVMTTTALIEFLRDRGYSIKKVAGWKYHEFERYRITDLIDGFFSRIPTLASGVVVAAEKS